MKKKNGIGWRLHHRKWAPLWCLPLLLLMGCQSMPPIHTVSFVDLDRFMGEWYVIASIPTIFEKGAYNGLETYALAKEGRVDISFTFNKDAFDGPEKRITSTGFIAPDSGNALWGVRFIWPFKAEYRVIWLNDDYTLTVVGRTKRDYVWIMARTPAIADDDYQQIVAFLGEEGYAVDQIRKVPQQRGHRPSP